MDSIMLVMYTYENQMPTLDSGFCPCVRFNKRLDLHVFCFFKTPLSLTWTKLLCIQIDF